MGTKVKTFDSTGVAPNGRLYAGDLNAIQDALADQINYSQEIDVAALGIGESALKLLRYGAGEARLSGAMRIDGIFRSLGGLYAGAFTTTQRDAIPAGLRPYGLIILNTTTNQIEWNKGTDAAPNWQPVAPVLGAGSITNTLLADGSADARVIQDGSVAAAEISGTLKPSVSAAAGTEALRALGTGANNACAGNDQRLTGVPGITVAGGNYTLVITDAGKVIQMTAASANTLTVPVNSSVAFTVGVIINVVQYGAGQTTIAPAGGVTVRSIPGLKFVGQYAMASLVKIANDEWVASGNLST